MVQPPHVGPSLQGRWLRCGAVLRGSGFPSCRDRQTVREPALLGMEKQGGEKALYNHPPTLALRHADGGLAEPDGRTGRQMDRQTTWELTGAEVSRQPDSDRPFPAPGSTPSSSSSFYYFFFLPSSPSSSSSSLRASTWRPGATFSWLLSEGVRCYLRVLGEGDIPWEPSTLRGVNQNASSAPSLPSGGREMH